MIRLAIITGIPMSEWVEYGQSGIASAAQILKQQQGEDEEEEE